MGCIWKSHRWRVYRSQRHVEYSGAVALPIVRIIRIFDAFVADGGSELWGYAGLARLRLMYIH
jgi:hypothetical protein